MCEHFANCWELYVWALWRISFSFFPHSTQTHILELIEELGLETYQQYNAGKKVHHMGGPSAKIRTYGTSIPALSPLVLMDLTQFLWRVRQQTDTKIFRTQSYVQVEQLKRQD